MIIQIKNITWYKRENVKKNCRSESEIKTQGYILQISEGLVKEFSKIWELLFKLFLTDKKEAKEN